MTLEEVNRQVALEMGWKPMNDGLFAFIEPKTSTLYRACPLFTAGEDTDLVRAWLESEGLWIEERSYLHYFSHTKETKRRHGCTLRGDKRQVWSVSLKRSRGVALCEAMLAYCASKKENGE